MSGGILAYLDACRDISEAQWLDISEDGEGKERADFWTIAQVVPWELRETGERFAQRWIVGEQPETALECWFRRVVTKLSKQTIAATEPWVILHAMAHAYAGPLAPSPADYATVANMPMESRHYARTVSIARKLAPDKPKPGTWLFACNG